MESTLNEVRILCSIDSEYVVGYNDAFLAKNGSELCIGMSRQYKLYIQTSEFEKGDNAVMHLIEVLNDFPIILLLYYSQWLL